MAAHTFKTAGSLSCGAGVSTLYASKNAKYPLKHGGASEKLQESMVDQDNWQILLLHEMIGLVIGIGDARPIGIGNVVGAKVMISITKYKAEYLADQFFSGLKCT